MAPQSYLAHDAVIRDFQATLRDCTVPAACSRSYVRTTKLTEWLKGQVGPSSHTTQASLLLEAAYRHRKQPNPPVSSEEISSGENCCLLVFSILLKLGLGELIDRFQRVSIVDKNLPIDPEILQNRLQAMDLAPYQLANVANLAEEFDAIQWRFCPAMFDFRVGLDHLPNRIIPIFKKEKINDKGGTAQLWQISVQEEFVSGKIRKACSNSRFHDAKDGFGWVSLIPSFPMRFDDIAYGSEVLIVLSTI
jgi:hypothetical protein